MQLQSSRAEGKWKWQLPSTHACPLSFGLRSLARTDLAVERKWWRRVWETADAPASFNSDLRKHFRKGDGQTRAFFHTWNVDNIWKGKFRVSWEECKQQRYRVRWLDTFQDSFYCHFAEYVGCDKFQNTGERKGSISNFNMLYWYNNYLHLPNFSFILTVCHLYCTHYIPSLFSLFWCCKWRQILSNSDSSDSVVGSLNKFHRIINKKSNSKSHYIFFCCLHLHFTWLSHQKWYRLCLYTSNCFLVTSGNGEKSYTDTAGL